MLFDEIDPQENRGAEVVQLSANQNTMWRLPDVNLADSGASLGLSFETGTQHGWYHLAGLHLYLRLNWFSI